MANVIEHITNANRISKAVAALAIVALVAAVTVVYATTASAGGQRPFKGNASGVFTGPDSGEGTITATHMGKGSVVFTNLVVDQTAPSPDEHGHVCFPTTGGDQTFTAANGDEINMTYMSGPFCIDPTTGAPVHGRFVTEVNGGTGRFDDATGVIIIDAVSEAPGTWSSVFADGSYIDY